MAGTLSNQPYGLAVVLGQIAALMCDLAAVLIISGALRRKGWVWLLSVVVAILAAKGLRVVTGSGTADLAYIVLLNLLFCTSGAVVAFQRPALLYKQVMVVCLLSVVAMLFQVIGAGSWTQLFANYGEGNLSEPVRTLFVRSEKLTYMLVQGRPAGILYSNVVLSLIIMYGLVMHFTRRTSAGVWRWGTTVIIGAAVLAQAKIVAVGFLVTVGLVLVLGDRHQRRRALAATVLVPVFLGLYSVLFPGLWGVNTDYFTLQASVFYRLNDIMAATRPDVAFRALQAPYFAGTPHLSTLAEGDFVSGYASVVARSQGRLGVLSVVAVVGIGLYRRGFRRLNGASPDWTLPVILGVAVIGLFPATHPIWSNPLFWFMMGLGFLPFVQLLSPRLLARAKHP
jgi:hypothetical protein